MSEDFLCIGDFICLFCEDTGGFVHCCQSSSAFNGIYIYHGQDKQKPTGIPNPHTITFQVTIQNRYKLNKKHRKYEEAHKNFLDNAETRAVLSQTKKAADAETLDNQAEQLRQNGRKVRYGDIIQLQHVFTEKYIHVSTSSTSKKDKSSMQVQLKDFSAKHAQFRVLPKYKVKSEGEMVQMEDQVIFESVKSPGQHLHASLKYQIDSYYQGSELNMTVDQTAFSLIKSSEAFDPKESLVRGGAVLRLYHKDLEAYLSAEGLWDLDDVRLKESDQHLKEEVHLRIRQADPMKPKTLQPTTSAITYWQVEAEESIIDGSLLRWEQQVRFRHLTTRCYLSIGEARPDGKMLVTTTQDASSPNTVFRLHPLLRETDNVQFDSYARIEHVLTGSWLHALTDEPYKRRRWEHREEDSSVEGLRWDGAALRQVALSSERNYPDAYTLQKVTHQQIMDANYVAGAVPCIQNLLVQPEGDAPKNRMTLQVVTVLKELKQFMLRLGEPIKNRQKLMRNFKVIDLLVRYLDTPVSTSSDGNNVISIFKAIYDTMHTCMLGKSKKNKLYFAKYISMFDAHIGGIKEVELQVIQIMVEIARDNRKVIDRISDIFLTEAVSWLESHMNYRYLDLLGVLCVCNNVAIPYNQRKLAELWIKKQKPCVYRTARGIDIGLQPEEVFISNDGTNWVALREFVTPFSRVYSEDQYKFYIHQLDLFEKLAYGRNSYTIDLICKDTGLLSWETILMCIKSTSLTEDLRAKFCDIITCLFVDVGTAASKLDTFSISYIYDEVPEVIGATIKVSQEVEANKSAKDGFPLLRNWISDFLKDNTIMVASQINKNKLLERVLHLIYHLVKFGYFSDVEDIEMLQQPLLSLLDGRKDMPFQQSRETELSKAVVKAAQQYRQKDRFEPSPETKAIVDAKFQAMEVLDLLLNYQLQMRLSGIVSLFKNVEMSEGNPAKLSNPLTPVLYDSYALHNIHSKKEAKEQKKCIKQLDMMFEKTAYFNKEQVRDVLLDLANYKYDKMVTKALILLDKLYSSKSDTFKTAVLSQVVVTPQAQHVHREVQKKMPLLRQLVKTKLNEQQTWMVCDIIDQFISFCDAEAEGTSAEFIAMNQNILLTNDILTTITDILDQEVDENLLDQYRGLKDIMRRCVRLLTVLARGNPAIQKLIMDYLDLLLKVNVVHAELALAIREAFCSNQENCIKVSPAQIEKIASLAAKHRDEAPEFLQLLESIVKVEGEDVTLRRNQTCVAKCLMQYRDVLGEVLDLDPEEMMAVLQGKHGEPRLKCLLNTVHLMASCAEGENSFIESLCQSTLTLDDILTVMGHGEIDCNMKIPFLRFLLWVYLRTGSSKLESGASSLVHNPKLWDYLSVVMYEVEEVTMHIQDDGRKADKALTIHVDRSYQSTGADQENKMAAQLQYLFDGVMPFLQTFFSKYYSSEESDLVEYEVVIVKELTEAFLKFGEVLRVHLQDPAKVKQVITTVMSMFAATKLPQMDAAAFLRKFETLDWMNYFTADNRPSNRDIQREKELNGKLKNFVVNCSLLYGGENNAAAQIKHLNRSEKKYASKREYTEIGGEDMLPLGEEFQEHLECFLELQGKTTTDRYHKATLLIRQLSIAAKEGDLEEINSLEQEDATVKSLQLLRAMIHNEERKLPENWSDNPNKHIKQLDHIMEIQTYLNSHGVLVDTVPLLGRQHQDTGRELLALLSMMLMHFNVDVQKSIMDYFLKSRDEHFFPAIRNRLHLSIVAQKERRALSAQQEARVTEMIAQAKAIQANLTVGKQVLQELTLLENEIKRRTGDNSRFVDLGTLQSKATMSSKSKSTMKSMTSRMSAKVQGNGTVKFDETQNKIHRIDPDDIELMSPDPVGVTVEADGVDNPGFQDAMSLPEPEYKDDGNINLVLQVLARLCNGQHEGLQNYLREQPDNMKSFNLVAETTQFLDIVYSNINGKNILLVVQIFKTLNELASGNQGNRSVILGNKIIDFTNFLLRSDDFPGCSSEQVLELRQVIANLVLSLVEENSPSALTLAKEVQTTLDKEATMRLVVECYKACQMEKKMFKRLFQDEQQENDNSVLSTARSFASAGKSLLQTVFTGDILTLKEKFSKVGFTYFFILCRLYDFDSQVVDDLQANPDQSLAIQYYLKNSMSVEIQKDDYLHKVNFRVKDRNVLRKEVREKLKWDVDRSSPSAKIQDLMSWYSDIAGDIRYQKKVLSSPLAGFFTKGWLLWNSLCIILSLAISGVMLVSWRAKGVGPNAPANTTGPWPIFDDDLMDQTLYEQIFYPLAIIHNVFSLFVLISYFLSNHPTFPTFSGIADAFRKCFRRKDEDEIEKKEVESHLEVHLFSFQTLYYLVFFALSVLGTFTYGYFFAFHLLNIVNNNPLLSGVIRAVTKNGKSLLMLALLGIVVIYIFALVAFAFFRVTFNFSKDEMFCNTLYECTVTVLRYGLVGDIYDYMRWPDSQKTFTNFTYTAVYYIMFFILITTIMMSVIMGIILDTFTQLRDEKWEAEKDMLGTCFICSRSNADFEHHGKGFQHHIKMEHNMWAYIYYFIYLDETRPDDYTAIDLYIKKMMLEGRYEFFPINRALSLTQVDQDTAETKMDDLMAYVMMLVDKQREEEAARKRKEDLQKLADWEERHKRTNQKSVDTLGSLELPPRWKSRRTSTQDTATSPLPMSNGLAAEQSTF